MYFGIFFVLTCALVSCCVVALEPTSLWCTKATLHDLRIQGCEQQPCTIRKGERLPFEYCFSFSGPPATSNRFQHSVFINYYAVPPQAFGSTISEASCEGRSCRYRSNRRYILRNSLYIDPNAECTAACDDMGPDGTGKRETTWKFYIANNEGNKTESAECNFRVTLNIVQ